MKIKWRGYAECESYIRYGPERDTPKEAERDGLRLCTPNPGDKYPPEWGAVGYPSGN